jgi:aspartate/methionine/tyrosine aminotransferase
VAESSAAAFSPSAVVVNSFSKYWSMTGWRVGWLLLPEDLVRPVECLAQNMFISAPHIAQLVAEAAMDCTPELEANKARYAASRAALLEGLPRAGFTDIAAADGAVFGGDSDETTSFSGSASGEDLADLKADLAAGLSHID